MVARFSDDEQRQGAFKREPECNPEFYPSDGGTPFYPEVWHTKTQAWAPVALLRISRKPAPCPTSEFASEVIFQIITDHPGALKCKFRVQRDGVTLREIHSRVIEPKRIEAAQANEDPKTQEQAMLELLTEAMLAASLANKDAKPQ